MTPTTLDRQAVEHRRKLADELSAVGVLHDPRWRQAWESVPRHVFVPRFAISAPGRPGAAHATWYDRTDTAQQAQWLAAAYCDEPLITRYAANGTACSSSTEPSLMARMLHLLDVHDGHTVLEIGTGTGYNAALLAARLGPDLVTTIDVDPHLTHTARAALTEAGYSPTVLTGDGAHGAAQHAPYDRIIATCGVDRIPAAWIEQLAVGGAILANVSRGLILLRDVDQHRVSGRFCGQAGFMALHTATDPPPPTSGETFEITSGTAQRQRDAPLPSDLPFTVASFLSSLLAPHSHLIFVEHEDGTVVQYRWWHPPSQSWVRVERDEKNKIARIYETGPRRLWSELAPLLAAWDQAGRPGIDHFGLTVTARQHTLWIGALRQPVLLHAEAAPQ